MKFLCSYFPTGFGVWFVEVGWGFHFCRGLTGFRTGGRLVAGDGEAIQSLRPSGSATISHPSQQAGRGPGPSAERKASATRRFSPRLVYCVRRSYGSPNPPDVMLGGMRKSLLFLTLLGVCQGRAQAPEPSTLALSLRVMSKSLASCREAYTHKLTGSPEALVAEVIGKSDYDKDLRSLGSAETFVNALIADPRKISGKMLVAILSTTDDFSVGVGSTRAELLRHIVIDQSTRERQTELMISAENLNSCQRSLFDAGDEFVGLVLQYVGTEDEALAKRTVR